MSAHTAGTEAAHTAPTAAGATAETEATAEIQENDVTSGATVWLTGLPSAGKTTIAHELAGRLRAEGRRVEVLDGDEIREFLSAGLGFSREDRHTNVQRIGFVAELLARNGVLALVPVIAPYADSRDAVRKRHEANRTPYVEIHVATPVEVCSVRDVKGLYAKQAAGELTGLTGVDDPYEEPETPDLRIESQNQTVQESAASVYALLTEKGLA
ncbi:adenylyl-sulfate kinase [Streptomyces sp. XM83C]|jgi:adenylylsulfate kinase|uniref:Adenylyl-sulfate kinase n=1 Tax=Streptomyces thermocoprophilus TaxID=78356 RepID=A0ABV5VC32_9ACTN|nr:adenylyl-sulfate kinase [Streptomyces sp. XM83C]MCK1822024.1 adenylyl-sulfate kinase [Streptomyces sp. XM83C]